MTTVEVWEVAVELGGAVAAPLAVPPELTVGDPARTVGEDTLSSFVATGLTDGVV